MPYIIGTKTFKTKDDIKQYFKKYHDTNPVGTILQGEYKAVMTDLIKWHPLYDDWNIMNEPEFKINLDFYKNKNYSCLNNGLWNVFSYIKCIKGGSIENNHYHNVVRAARNAIQEDIMKFRVSNINNGYYTCEICKNEYKNIEVDHTFDIITFKQILTNFIKTENKDYKNFKLIYENEFHLFNQEDEDKFITFHNIHAKLRCLCISCHRNKTNT